MKLLFVCLGNICRSPSAEAVMNMLIEENGLQDQIVCDSAGTYGGHAGELADRRMRKHATKRGINLTSRSRQIRPSDLNEFDYIIAMDSSNYNNILRLVTDKAQVRKIVKMTDYCSRFDYNEVPDPYYGGSKGFELVLDLLEDACQGFLDKLKEELN